MALSPGQGAEDGAADRNMDTAEPTTAHCTGLHPWCWAPCARPCAQLSLAPDSDP